MKVQQHHIGAEGEHLAAGLEGIVHRAGLHRPRGGIKKIRQQPGNAAVTLHDQDAQPSAVGAAQADTLLTGEMMHILQTKVPVTARVDMHVQHAPLQPLAHRHR